MYSAGRCGQKEGTVTLTNTYQDAVNRLLECSRLINLYLEEKDPVLKNNYEQAVLSFVRVGTYRGYWDSEVAEDYRRVTKVACDPRRRDEWAFYVEYENLGGGGVKKITLLDFIHPLKREDSRHGNYAGPRRWYVSVAA